MKFMNEASWDRIVRVVAGVILLALSLGNVVSGVLSILFIIFGVILLLTGIVGFCPLYALLKIRTNKS